MLSGVLLHVVPATRGINQTINALAFRQLLRNDMKDSSVFFLGYFRYRHFPFVRQNKFTCVINLSTTRRVKRSTIQHHSNPSVSLRGLKHTCFKLKKEGIVIVETLSHEIYDL